MGGAKPLKEVRHVFRARALHASCLGCSRSEHCSEGLCSSYAMLLEGELVLAQATGAATNGAPSTSTLDRKRKAEPSTDAAPDVKRPTFSSGQGARPTRSNTTGAGAGAGGRNSVQQATSARTGPSQVTGGGSELGPIAEESWDDIHDRTGQGVDDVLNKKLGFPKGTKPERKVEAFVPFVKELKWVMHHNCTPGCLPHRSAFCGARMHPNPAQCAGTCCSCRNYEPTTCVLRTCGRALGRHLHSTNQRLELDVEQWKRHSAELSEQAEKERKEWAAKQEAVGKQMQEIKELLELQVRRWMVVLN